jgi:hypothetical protein
MSLEPLPRNPSKQDEIDHVAQFVGALPRFSYLASLLVNLPALCEHEIRNDWAFPVEVAQSWAQRLQEEQRTNTAREEHKTQREALEREIARLEREKRTLSREVDALKTAARELLSSLQAHI